MKKKVKASIAALLCFCIVISASSATFASAKAPDTDAAQILSIFDSDEILRKLIVAVWRIACPILENAVGVIADALPESKNWIDYDKYESKNFYPGHEYFLDEQTKSSVWSLGYSQEILTPEDLETRGYYMAGYSIGKITFKKYDDIKVRTICLDDGSGRGKVAFSVIDAIGLANSDVRKIRERLAAFASEKNIVSINVGVTHTHSGLDTQGIWSKEPQTVFNNILSSIFDIDTYNGTDPALMERIFTLTAKSVRDACSGMKQGSLTLATKDISSYVMDKCDPDYFISDLYRFKFTPYDGSKGTIIANFGAHPETVGFTTDSFPGDTLSADYVPYIEEVVNKGGFNFMFFQGAIGSLISANRHLSGDELKIDRYQEAVRYGQEIGYILLGMSYKTEQECIDYVLDKEREAADMAASDKYTPWYKDWVVEHPEKEVAPILNIALKEILFKVDNPFLQAVGKVSLTNNTMVVDDDGSIYTPTEIGYMEIGKDLKVILMPGETAPELIIGGKTMTSQGSCSGEDFMFKPLRDIVGENLIVFDVMNDATGYIIPDNDCGIGTLRYYDGRFMYDTNGMLSFSNKAASTFISNFLELVESKS